MSVIDFPTSQPPTFAQLTRNPERDRAEVVLQAFIAGMKEEAIPRGVIIRTLFNHLMEQLQTAPDGDVSTKAQDAEQTNILNEIDSRWKRVRDALSAADPDFFKPP